MAAGARSPRPGTFRYPMLHQGLIRTSSPASGARPAINAPLLEGWRLRLRGRRPDSRGLIEQETARRWQGSIRVVAQAGAAGRWRCCRKYGRSKRLGRADPAAVGGRNPVAATRPEQTPPCRASASRPPPSRMVRLLCLGRPSPEGRERDDRRRSPVQGGQGAGNRILRDKEQLGLGDSISKFMRIGRATGSSSS